MSLPQYSTALSVKEVFVSFSLSILDTTATQALNIVTIFREMDQERPLFGSRGMKAAVVQRVQEVRNKVNRIIINQFFPKDHGAL